MDNYKFGAGVQSPTKIASYSRTSYHQRKIQNTIVPGVSGKPVALGGIVDGILGHSSHLSGTVIDRIGTTKANDHKKKLH